MKESTFASRALRFYSRLECPRVPRGIEIMNPYAVPRIRRYVRAFLDKYFADNRERTLVVGINPGRFGAGLTGVTFADPVALADFCGIPNDLPRRRELSSVFIYDFIKRFGGPRRFHSRFFLSAVCPLGFTANGKNVNYYDSPALERAVTPFIVKTLKQQIAFGARRDRVIVLGLGENRRFLAKINAEHGFFDRIVALKHPRPIMQYNRRSLELYLAEYEKVFSAALG